uniref:Pseudouridine-metabolizing bifunctional protein C1861.05-like n=1 Tax=Saccoglossus kowalevskii TaxID=10224 RepID=A0ABM0MK29_SACKO|nr:PREDICTED: pseudouridine-metabolizing bifunctional protein C1861.05-like [Saccoglossus kowalevskii]
MPSFIKSAFPAAVTLFKKNSIVTHLKKRNLSNGVFCVHSEISEAISVGKPVVALESTIITHGMPYPHNLRTALLVESVVRENHCVPATIAVLHGKIHIGLTETQLETLSTYDNCVKVSRRDLSLVLSKGLMGGTTVSGTMVAAHKFGIHVFVTGGIGGVHRGAESTMDISADLIELGRTPMAVVSAGIKSILDIGKTLEYLETEGVTVAAYGKNKEFPAFFTPNSGYTVPYNLKTPQEAAKMIERNLSLGLNSGMLIGVPIPKQDSDLGELIDAAIQQSVEEAQKNGIVGKEVTPFILERVNELTEGKSLDANIALIRNNAKVGSHIAYELSKLMKTNGKDNNRNKDDNKKLYKRYSDIKPRPIVFGASIVDFMSTITKKNIMYHGGTNPGKLKQCYGGVGRNLADCLSRLDANPIFVSAIGDDNHASNLLNYCQHIDTGYIQQLPGEQTATYCLVLNHTGEVVLGIGDMEVNAAMTPNLISKFEKEISQAPLVCMDANLPVDAINYICELSDYYKVPVWFEPTCVVKCKKPFNSDSWKSLTYISPNVNELGSITELLDGNLKDIQTDYKVTDLLPLCDQLLHHISCVIVTLGKDGVLVCRNTHAHQPLPSGKKTKGTKKGLVSAVHFTATDSENIVSVSGAGDCLASFIIHGAIQGFPPNICIEGGLKAASYSLLSHHAVPPTITPEQFTQDEISKWSKEQSIKQTILSR